MGQNFHELFGRPEQPLPSDRSTGLVFAVVSLIVAYVWRSQLAIATTALGLAATFFVVSMIAPFLLRPLNVAWMWVGMLLSKIMNPVIMLLLFSVVVVPAGLVMQRVYDPMRRRRQTGAASYWIERPSGDRSSMTNQF